MATSNNVKAEEALSNLSSTAGIDLVALRRKYLAVKENSETSSSHEINRENKFENMYGILYKFKYSIIEKILFCI